MPTFTPNDESSFFKQEGLEQLLKNTTLGDASTLSKGITLQLTPGDGKVEYESSEDDAPTGALALKIQASLNAKLFNATDQKDPYKYWNQENWVPYRADHPVMQYDVEFAAQAGLTGSLKGLSLSLDAESQVNVLVYRQHSQDTKARQALWSDLTTMPFPFFIKHLEGLKPNEGLGFISQASLGLGLTFETTEVLTSGLSGLSNFLDATETIKVDVDLGAKVKVEAGISDTFKVFFLKQEDGSFRVVINKAKEKQVKAGASLSVSAKLDDAAGLSKLIRNHAPGLLNRIFGVEGLENLLSAREEGQSVEDLAQKHPETLEALAHKFGLSQDTTETVLNFLGKQLDTLEEKFGKQAEKSIGASLAFEYSRSRENSTMLEATLTAEQLRQYHPDLMRTKTKALVEAALDENSKIKLHDYAAESVLRTSRSFKLGVSIGKWDVSIGTTKTFKRTEETNRNGDVKLTFDGRKSRKADGTLWEQTNFGNLTVSMPNFKKASDLQMRDFSYGFTLGMTTNLEGDPKKYKASFKERIQNVMDVAAAWGALPGNGQAEVEEVYQLLTSSPQEGKDDDQPTFSLQMKIPDAFLEGFREQWLTKYMQDGREHRKLIALAMGRVMPIWGKDPIRKDPIKKSRFYGGVFKDHLQRKGFGFTGEDMDGSRGPEDYVKMLVQNNKWLSSDELRNERQSLYKVLANHHNMGGDWSTFHDGISNLLGYMHTEEEYSEEKMKALFGQFEAVWAQAFYVQALGHYFYQLSQAAKPEFRKLVEVSFEMNYLKDGKPKRRSFVRTKE